MGIDAIIRSGFEAVAAATDGLQEVVSHESALAPDAFGTVTGYSSPVARRALVQRKHGSVQTPGGNEHRYQAIISFLEPVAVDPRDRITLWDGVTGSLYVPSGGLSDPSTGAPFATTVYLGGR